MILKKIKIICYIIVIIEKYKYDLLCLLHLKVANIYTYNFLSISKNVYKISFVIYTENFYKMSLIIYKR